LGEHGGPARPGRAVLPRGHQGRQVQAPFDGGGGDLLAAVHQVRHEPAKGGKRVRSASYFGHDVLPSWGCARAAGAEVARSVAETPDGGPEKLVAFRRWSAFWTAEAVTRCFSGRSTGSDVADALGGSSATPPPKRMAPCPRTCNRTSSRFRQSRFG